MGAVDNVITGVKQLREIARKLENAELLATIADLQLDAVGLKSDMLTLRDENLALRQQNEELRRQADVRSKIESRDGIYYATETIKGYGDGPFCHRCMDQYGDLMGLIAGAGMAAGRFRDSKGNMWSCHRCAIDLRK